MSNTTGKSFVLSLFLGGVAWGSTRIYANYCVPEGFSGFLQSLVTMDSSPCQAVFSLISHSNTLYASMIASMLFSMFSGFNDIILYVNAPQARLEDTHDCTCPSESTVKEAPKKKD